MGTEAKRRFLEFLTYAAATVTIAGLGMTMGTQIGQGKQDLLEEENKRLEAEVSKLSAESAKNKDLLVALTQCQATSRGAPQLGPPVASGRRVTIPTGDSGQVGDVELSVSGIEVLYNPLRYEVSMIFHKPSEKSLQAKLKVGESITYAGYEVRLLNADLTRAQVAIGGPAS